MISWPITYTDYNGDTVKETCYFNIDKAELIQMQFDVNGTYNQYIERISQEHDLQRLGAEFTKLILGAYGKKSDDGRRFIKSEELTLSFKQSPAYSELLMQLLTDEEKAAKFMRGILPADLNETAEGGAVLGVVE